MIDLSPTLAAAYRDRIQYPVVKVEVVPRGAGPTTPALATLKVSGCEVNLDQTRPVRRALANLVVPVSGPTDPLVPRKPGDLLHWLSPNELRVTYGRATGLAGARTPEYAPLGVFGYDKPTLSDDGKDVALVITGQDRAAKISTARWTDPFQIRRGATIPQAMRLIAEDRWPSAAIPLQFDFTACADHPIMTMTCPNAVYGSDHTSSDPWPDLATLAAVGGAEVYLGPDGVVAVVPYTDPDTVTPVAAYSDGSTPLTPLPAGGIETPPLAGGRQLVKVQRSGDIARTYSGVVVTGGNSQDPSCRAEWWDTNPDSPTYVETFGKVPAFYDQPLITNEAQCRIVAQAIGSRLRMGGEVLTFDAVPNGAYEGNDGLSVSVPAIMDDGTFLLEKFTLDASEAPKPMSVTSRLTNQPIEGVTIT